VRRSSPAATACARFGMECTVYMGSEDIRRQALNVYRMRLLGARVVEVEAGSGTLKDAINEAIRDWVTNVDTTHYIIGSAVGPAPYPAIVRDLQRVIGDEARAQILEREGRPTKSRSSRSSSSRKPASARAATHASSSSASAGMSVSGTYWPP